MGRDDIRGSDGKIYQLDLDPAFNCSSTSWKMDPSGTAFVGTVGCFGIAL